MKTHLLRFKDYPTMHLLPLVFTVLVIFLLREGLAESEYYEKFNADLSAVEDGYKTYYPFTSLVSCASLTKPSCVYCITGTSCVVVGKPPVPVEDSGAVQCYNKTSEKLETNFG